MQAISCPKCYHTIKQSKDGYTSAGSQRYRCRICGCRYTPYPKEHGYDEDIRFQALQLYLEGMKIREIARRLQVNHQSVANWIQAYTHFLPPDTPPEIVELARLEGLYVL